MSHEGFSHIGLSTLDLDTTRAFYEGVLGFKAVRCDTIRVKEGGRIRHIFFDTGHGQLIAFMEARGVAGVPAQYEAGIARGLGVPSVFYHFAFEAGSEDGLESKRRELEYCCYTRALGADDARMQDRFEISARRLGLEDADALRARERVPVGSQ
jgi:catechol 2,3-dioxygenase-like lactoylglutathione lyase family enzyme